jgi:SMC interacting uncharacterized protein involved in chromosome segregation
MENSKLFQQQALIRDQVMLIINLLDKWIDHASTECHFDDELRVNFYLKKCEMINFQENIIDEFKDSRWDNIEYVKRISKDLEETKRDYKLYRRDIMMFKDYRKQMKQNYYFKRLKRCEYCD